MFNPTDFCLLEQISQLEEIGLTHFRYDNRFNDSISIHKLNELFLKFSIERAKALKETYPNRVIRGFYHKNKSDVLFTKLKNQHIQRSDKNYFGEVFHVQKGEWLGVMSHTNESLTIGQELKIITPEGKIKKSHISLMENSRSQKVESTTCGQFYKINFTKGVSVKSSLYFS